MSHQLASCLRTCRGQKHATMSIHVWICFYFQVLGVFRRSTEIHSACTLQISSTSKPLTGLCSQTEDGFWCVWGHCESPERWQMKIGLSGKFPGNLPIFIMCSLCIKLRSKIRGFLPKLASRRFLLDPHCFKVFVTSC